MTATPQRRLRVVGIADTDSYVKWAAALLAALDPEDWEVELLVLDTPVVVSEQQQRAALAGTGLERVMRVTFAALGTRLARQPPDAVLIAARGPLVRVVARLVAGLAPRPVLVSGLPGISVPATRKSLVYRTQCDLFVLHSRREVREFAALARSRGLSQRFALTRLPFAARSPARTGDRPEAGGFGPDRPVLADPPVPGATTAAGRARTCTDLVFAAQAIVPRDRADRRRLAELLVRAARADPSRRVVLKLRASAGEHQTHAEADPLTDLVASLGPRPANLVFSTAPMATALDSAEGLVTVSSTAAIEAVARGIPVIALDTFGVSARLINEVFQGSGLYGGEEDVVARRFRHPSPAWLRDNYFHDAADDDVAVLLSALIARRREGRLAAKPPLRRTGGALRDAWERKLVLGDRDRTVGGAVAGAIGMPVRGAVRALQRTRAAARRSMRLSRAA
ncbi:DUF6716 putative glycosyltransferase [Microbacterium sp. BK668]|uniref:DUF6716 putative glycosyltransferase n=1 Tax=Microbacterium sp. BK668 TaxID=2512118 RepID=UPI00105CE973|nr:DUF6716 putative glycosyltransferase [Microbacterium sp. BK668]TDN93147.1 hypothetical protein EV279_2690 [Microbacterium sp. BK668]